SRRTPDATLPCRPLPPHDGEPDMKKTGHKSAARRSTECATTDALEIIHRRFYSGRPGRVAGMEEAAGDDDVARKIRTFREAAGLTQRELAKLAGTTASVICRLEDAEYSGHSLAMLNRVAAALHRRVKIELVPARRRKSA